MGILDTPVNSLKHYSSEFYDPVKAHEYYLKNRQLKGGSSNPAKPLTKEQRAAQAKTATNQREAQSYVNNQIRTKKAADSKQLSKGQTERIAALQKNVTARQAEISAKLKGLVSQLQAQVAATPQTKLNEIPENASPKIKAYLTRQNDLITRDNQNAKRAASAKASKSSADAQKAASAELKKIGTNLQTAVKKARTDYAAARKALDTKYSTAAKQEAQNIKSNVR